MPLDQRNLDILKALHRFRYMTAQQLTLWLHEERYDFEAISKRLRALAHRKYLRSERRYNPKRQPRRGSEPLVYSLGPSAVNELVNEEEAEHHSLWRFVRERVSPLTVKHRLLDTEFHLWLSLAERAFPERLTIGSYIRPKKTRAGKMNLRFVAEIKGHEYVTVPDAFLRLDLPDRRLGFAIEFVTGKRNLSTIVDKCLIYYAHRKALVEKYRGREFEEMFGVRNYQVVVSCPSDTHLKNIQADLIEAGVSRSTAAFLLLHTGSIKLDDPESVFRPVMMTLGDEPGGLRSLVPSEYAAAGVE